jgi:hypothetical protein
LQRVCSDAGSGAGVADVVAKIRDLLTERNDGRRSRRNGAHERAHAQRGHEPTDTPGQSAAQTLRQPAKAARRLPAFFAHPVKLPRGLRRFITELVDGSGGLFGLVFELL